jgi:sec-independent protein translocase protein TatA
MFGLGFPELMLIFVIALIVFGPKKLPELGRSVGRELAEFKKASEDFQESMKAEMKDVEKTVQLDELKKIGEEITTEETKQASKPETAPQEQEKGKKEDVHGNS